MYLSQVPYYNPIPENLKGNFLLPLNGKTAKRPLVSNRPVLAYPGVTTWDTEHMNYRKILANLIASSDVLKCEMDKSQRISGGSMVFEDPYVLLTTSGVYADPVSYPVINNQILRGDLGLTSDGALRSERHEKIFDEMVQQFFGYATPCAITVPKGSSFGAGATDEYNEHIKIGVAHHIIDDYTRVLNLVHKGDWNSLAYEYAVVPSFTAGYRGQNDAPGKVRWANTLDYARTSGRKGERIQTNKAVGLNGITWEGFTAQRVRLIYQGNWGVNVILGIAFKPTMEAVFKRFPKSFHVEAPEISQAMSAMRKAGASVDFFATDATEFDSSHPSAQYHRLFVKLLELGLYHPSVIKLLYHKYTAPIGTQPLERSSYVDPSNNKFYLLGRLWNEDIALDDFSKYFGGNRSGIWTTSMFNKFFMYVEQLCKTDDIFMNVVGNVKGYLEHDPAVCKLYHANNGDDHVTYGTSANVQKYRDYCRATHPDTAKGLSYYKSDEEKGGVFSGSALLSPELAMQREMRGEPTYVARPIAALAKAECPERGIDSKFRRGWAMGMQVRNENIAAHPSGSLLLNLQNQAWYESGLQAKIGARHLIISKGVTDFLLQASELGIANPSSRELEILAEPEKLAYKKGFCTEEDIRDIRPQVLEQVRSSIPYERYMTMHAALTRCIMI